MPRQMTLMELLGMERLQLQTRSELETLRQEARAAQVTVSIGSHRIVPRIIPQNQSAAATLVGISCK